MDGPLIRLTTSQRTITPTKTIPSTPTTLGARRRLRGDETDASAATGGATLLSSLAKDPLRAGYHALPAEVAELADAPASKSAVPPDVWGRFPPSASSGQQSRSLRR